MPETAEQTPKNTASLWMRFLPVVVFLGLTGFLGYALLTPNEAPDPVIERAAPNMIIPELPREDAAKGQSDFKIVNFWASWCTPCLAEHEPLMLLAQSGITIEGVAYRDTVENIDAYLTRHGNPFTTVRLDPKGDAMRQFGVNGVPESFVVDKNGKVRLAIRGVIEPGNFERDLLPLLKILKEESENQD